MGQPRFVVRPWFSLQQGGYMQIAHEEWSMACAALLGNCLGKCYSDQAKILPGTVYATAKSIDFQPAFSLLIQCKLCGLSSNKWPCHGQTIYSSFWRRQEELAAPQLLQAPGGQTPPACPVSWAGRAEFSEEKHETWALTSLTGIKKCCTNAEQCGYFIRILPGKHEVVGESVWKQKWALLDLLV